MDTQAEFLAPAQTEVDVPPYEKRDDRFADLYTRRLRRLMAIRRDHGERMNEQGLRLLDRAIYSTYCDCVDLGVGATGRQLIEATPARVTPG